MYPACLKEETSKLDRADRLLPRPVLVEVYGAKDQRTLVVQHSQWKVLEVDDLVSPQLVPRRNRYVPPAGSIIGDSVGSMHVITVDRSVILNENAPN